MTRICQTALIKAPAPLIFEQSQDYSVRQAWDSFHGKVVKLNDSAKLAAGSQLRVYSKHGVPMEVEFIQFNPPHSAAITMRKGPGFLRQFSGSWVFRALTPTVTEVSFIYGFKTHWWTLPVVTERLFAWYFSRLMKARLEGLQRYCEQLSAAHHSTSSIASSPIISSSSAAAASKV